MKSASIPSLRVTPELRAAAENVLREGESLSSFVETSLRQQIYQRQCQQDFIARGLASRDAAKASGRYASKQEVMDSLHAILKVAEQR